MQINEIKILENYKKLYSLVAKQKLKILFGYEFQEFSDTLIVEEDNIIIFFGDGFTFRYVDEDEYSLAYYNKDEKEKDDESINNVN